ncbi:MAG TPA: CAP domain-containing protein [Thermomicrobiales bacterium]|nr:CAP domain-containing protein [Thermomicrobiales bacterium]
MHPRLVVVICLFLTGVMVATLGSAVASPGSSVLVPSAAYTTAAEYSPDAEECGFLTLINNYRAQNNRQPLTLLKTLSAPAEHHSVDMAVNNYWHDDHTLFDGTTFDQNIHNHAYAPLTVGENILYGWNTNSSYNLTAQLAFDQWKASPSHNSNMLSSNFTAIGIGRATIVRNVSGQNRT